MSVSSRFAVAVHILLALDFNNPNPVTSEQLAYSASTNAVVIRKLISSLVQAELVQTQLGAGGGAYLAKPSSEISLLDIYNAVETAQIFATHRCEPAADCFVGCHVLELLNPVLANAEDALFDVLAQVKLSSLNTQLKSFA